MLAYSSHKAYIILVQQANSRQLAGILANCDQLLAFEQWSAS